MNRSRRRATVITWAIAASVLHGGAGLVVAGVAAADPATSGEPAGEPGGAERGVRHGGADRGARPTGSAVDTRRPRARRAVPVPAETVRLSRGRRDSVAQTDPATGGPTGEVPEEWPCPWWPIIWPDVHPPPEAAHDPRGFTPVDNGGVSLALAAAYSAGVPAAQPGFGPPTAPGEYFVDLSPVTAQPPDAVAGASARPALGASVPPAGPSAAPPGVAPLSGPSVGASPPLRPDAVGKPSESVLPGYQGSLRAADVGVLAVAALPGLAAIAGLTALGGFLGYRQARAGYLLRAAGAGRFLQ